MTAGGFSQWFFTTIQHQERTRKVMWKEVVCEMENITEGNAVHLLKSFNVPVKPV